MKADLTLALIKKLRLEFAPTGVDASGALVFAPNPTGKSYILWDSSRDSPPGFGVRVASKKTYIIRRKVRGKSIMPTVGNCADFNKLEDARKKAADMARAMVDSGANPNKVAREESAAEITVGQALAAYREFLATRTQRPATADTLRVVDRQIRKFAKWNWSDKKVRELSTDEIERKFKEGVATPSANEQAFQWASAAVRWRIEKEELAAAAARRPPGLVANPFQILVLHSLYRSQDQLNKEREDKGKRNPLRPSTSLGAFLEAAWSKKDTNDNLTGIHYLMLMLLWGCRKSEHADLVWGELVPARVGQYVGRRVTSHVWLGDDPDYGPNVFFHKTKNGKSHRLPIGPMAAELLRRRQEAAAVESVERGFGAKSRPFVFPAKSKLSKTGHYSDASDLLIRLREEIGVERLNRHDLRRSFGSVMQTLTVPEAIQRAFLNHAKANVTEFYTAAEWALLREWIERIEQFILSKAPNVYNALKPVDWPMLPAPEPHVVKPPRPRTGRPRKLGGSEQPVA